MEIRRDSYIPLYRQITEHYRSQILSGELPPGFRLPPERRLAEMLGVNRSTVVVAYGELVAAGLVETQPGSGTVVIHRAGFQPDWTAYVETGQFLPDSALRQEVLGQVHRPGTLSLIADWLPPECHPDFKPLLGQAPVDRLLGLPDPEDYPPLREELARLMIRAGEDAHPENILILNGAQQGFHLAPQCLLQPGDTAVAESPSYIHSLGIFPSAGVKLFRVDSDRDGLCVPALATLLARRSFRLLVITPSYANPTGATLPVKRRDELLALCGRYQLPVLEDDPYRGLSFSGDQVPSLKSRDRHGLVLYLGSFSKSLGPGPRISWISGPLPVVERLTKVKRQIDSGTSLLPQWLVSEWLRRGEHEPHLERLRNILRRRCEALEEALHRHLSGVVSWESPAGGYHLWCRLDLPVTSAALFRNALRQGVAVMPGELFGRESAGAPHLRLSFAALPPAELDEAVRRLALSLKQGVSVSP